MWNSMHAISKLWLELLHNTVHVTVPATREACTRAGAAVVVAAVMAAEGVVPPDPADPGAAGHKSVQPQQSSVHLSGTISP